MGVSRMLRARPTTLAPRCQSDIAMRWHASRGSSDGTTTVKALTIVVLAVTCAVLPAAASDESSLLGTSRLVDLRYEMNVKLPSGVLPCELTPSPNTVHAVEKAVFEAINSDVAPLPARSDVHLACVCQGAFCDEHCESNAVQGAAALGAAPGKTGKAQDNAKTSKHTQKPSKSADPNADVIYDYDYDYDYDTAPYENPWVGDDDSGDGSATLGSTRFYTLWEKCSMNSTFYDEHESTCSNLTEEDGAYELEHKCRRPGFRQVYGPQCPHPSGQTVTEDPVPLVDPVSDLEACQAKCASTSHCCNSDPSQGSNQHLSCLQACMVVKSGVSGDECLSYCPKRQCAYDINGERYTACQTCDDVPAHKARFGDSFVGANYTCTAVYGTDEESCEAGCAAGVEIDTVVVDETGSGTGTDPDTTSDSSTPSVDSSGGTVIENWYNGHASVGCMPVVPTGQPKYTVLWEKCHTNWVFHKRNAERCEGLTESDGCAELEKHCARLQFAEEYHDQCQGLIFTKQMEERVEGMIDDRVKVLVDAKLDELAGLTEDDSDDSDDSSQSAHTIAMSHSISVLEQKLNAVIHNMTEEKKSCDPCVAEKIKEAMEEHLREYHGDDETPEETPSPSEEPTCLTPTQAFSEEKLLYDDLSDLDKCRNQCAAEEHCCNNDITQGSNQQLSCLQACMVVKSGVPKQECLAYCQFRSCSRWIRGVHYEDCRYCDDVPEHEPQWGDAFHPAPYTCSSTWGTSTKSCEDGCAAGEADAPVFYPGDRHMLSLPRCGEESEGPNPSPAFPDAPAPVSAQMASPGLDEESEESKQEPESNPSGGPLLGCSPVYSGALGAEQRNVDQFITLRFGITVPVAVRAETIHAIKADDVLLGVARRLEDDDAFKLMWPGLVDRSDFSLNDIPPVVGEEAVADARAHAGRAVQTEAPHVEVSRPTETPIPTQETLLSRADTLDDPLQALQAQKEAMEQRRLDALRDATQAVGQNTPRTVSGALLGQSRLGDGVGGAAEGNSGSGVVFGLSAVALVAVFAAAKMGGEPKSSGAERLPLTGKVATVGH